MSKFSHAFYLTIIAALTISTVALLIDRVPEADTDFAVEPANHRVAVFPFHPMNAPASELAATLTSTIAASLYSHKNFELVPPVKDDPKLNNPCDQKPWPDQSQASHFLEGSVQRSGDAIRIAVQLVDCANNWHLWSKSFDTNIDQVESVVATIESSVIMALGG